MEFSTFSIRTSPFPMQGVSGFFLIIPCFIEIPVFNANSVDFDQSPRSAMSDLGLYCFDNVWVYTALTMSGSTLF